MRELKTISEVAREFGVALHVLRYLIDSGKLADADFVVVGGRRHWTPKTIKKTAALLGKEESHG